MVLDLVCSEKEMLEGNINRMCVTDDMDDLEYNYQFARKRIEAIYQINRQRFADGYEAKPVMMVERCVFCGRVIPG